MGTHRSQTAGPSREQWPGGVRAANVVGTIRRGSPSSGGIVVLSAAALLTGCPTVDLGDSPTDIGNCNPARGLEYFETEVYPNFIQPSNAVRGCTQSGLCHHEGSSNLLIFKTQPVDVAFNYKASQNFIDCGMPSQSQLLTRPLNEVDPHGGGNLFPMSDPSVQVFLDWFVE